MAKATDLYAGITAQILEQLETGTAPWVKPWSDTPGMNHPHNAVTGRPYSGCNVVLLWMAQQSRGWTVPRYLTFKQAQEAGGNVRKGEHGTKVYFVKRLVVQDRAAPEGEEDSKIIPMMREYTVFNVAQCENLPDKLLTVPTKAPRNKDERDAIADEFVTCLDATITEGHGQACYSPKLDAISMPAFAAFKDADNFYSTEFHELAHWTGHKSRLDRFAGIAVRFGDKAYAAEELVAELCAAFLCAEFDIDGDLRHAAYIASWITLLKADPRAFVTAASKAQAAADYMRGLALAEPMAIAA